jgi:hypothetical protein
MVAKDRVPLSAGKSAPSEGVWQQQGSEAANALQKELLEAYKLGHAENHPVVEQRMAIWKHVKAVASTLLQCSTSKWERVHGPSPR